MVFTYPQRSYGGFGYPRGYFDWDDPFEYYDAPPARSNYGPAKRRSNDFIERQDCFELHLDARRVRPADISVNLDTKTRMLTVSVEPATAFAQPTRLEFELPDEAATEGIKSALTNDGTLKIIVPKAVKQMDVDVRPRPQQVRQPQSQEPQQSPQRSPMRQWQQPQKAETRRTQPQSQSQQPPQTKPAPPKQGEPKRPQKQPSKDEVIEEEWWKRDQVLEELSPEEAAARALLLAAVDSDSEGDSDEDLSDMLDEEDAFRVSIDIRGFSPSEVSVAVDDADCVLTVSGEHEDRSSEGHLIATNSFKRSFVLPSTCDAADVSRDDSQVGIVKVSVGKK